MQEYFIVQFESFALLFSFAVQLAPIITLLGGTWSAVNHVACHLFFFIFDSGSAIIVVLVALICVVILIFIFGQVLTIKLPEFVVRKKFLFCDSLFRLN